MAGSSPCTLFEYHAKKKLTKKLSSLFRCYLLLYDLHSHTFSFAGYYDPKFEQFGSLRVINEDRVSPKNGFDTHPHRDYEIYSYIVNGELTHRDSMGNVEVMKRGDVQFTSAGTGILHSEHNKHACETVHFLQIWVKPNQKGLKPHYCNKKFADEEKLNQLCLIVAPEEKKFAQATQLQQTTAPIVINQDAYTYASILQQGKTVNFKLQKSRQAYLHLIMTDPQVSVKLNNDKVLQAGDGAFISASNDEEFDVTIEGLSAQNAEFVLFDVAKQ